MPKTTTRLLNWKKTKLYYGAEDTKFSVVPSHYQVRWPDGTLSEDYYNLTRAKEYARNKYLSSQKTISPEALG